MAKKRVFVSFDHSEDLHYKNLLKAWNTNPNLILNLTNAHRMLP
jgi:hypothetical protein